MSTVGGGSRIGVIGAGIVGLAVARRLGQVEPDAKITVLEKETQVAAHQTGHNSGVAHAGVYYTPGSMKAKLCRRGIGMLKEFCAEHEIPYQECGKLIVARNPIELERLDEIERRARANGVPGLRRIGPEEISEFEPHVRGAGALHSPTTAIVDYSAVSLALADELSRAGGQLRLGYEVAAIDQRETDVRVVSVAGEACVFDRLVVCAGLQSDRLARMAGDRVAPWIIPFRGEYQRLVPERRELVRALVYPVPDPAYPFLGVHFTKRVDGGVDIGPNAVLAFKREGYRRRDFSLSDLTEVFASRGFRRLAREHWRMGLAEMRGSLSRRAFMAEAKTFIPELTLEDVEPAPAGVRAQAVGADGSLVDDFAITELPRITLVRNAPSPAATSSLAIGEYVVDLALGVPGSEVADLQV